MRRGMVLKAYVGKAVFVSLSKDRKGRVIGKRSLIPF